MPIVTGQDILAADVLDLIELLFGDGSDGDIVTAGGGGGDVTLTRDMYYNSLTVTAGDTVTTGGFRIFTRTTLTNRGIITNGGGDGGNGGNGANGVAGAAGAAGAVGASGSLGGGSIGTAGAVGRVADGAGNNSGASAARVQSLGGIGGDGGDGGAVR